MTKKVYVHERVINQSTLSSRLRSRKWSGDICLL